jgi:two-component system, chemotaxis family, protein-glutamate methylesterase/glutaminase
MGKISQYEAIVMGTSAGGLMAVTKVLKNLSADYPIPILLVQHRARDSQDLFEEVLQEKCKIRIKQADEKELVRGGTVYVAPPNYHLLVEMNRTLSLSSDAPVQFSRPSIDVLFESAAIVYKRNLVGIILTGSNNDGAMGITTIASLGGLTVAQDPKEAQYSFMTQAAIDTKSVKHTWSLAQIEGFLVGLQEGRA